ncbi:unnamed protein product, partial [Ectocarpus sp. 13 AM-2016]
RPLADGAFFPQDRGGGGMVALADVFTRDTLASLQKSGRDAVIRCRQVETVRGVFMCLDMTALHAFIFRYGSGRARLLFSQHFLQALTMTSLTSTTCRFFSRCMFWPWNVRRPLSSVP